MRLHDALPLPDVFGGAREAAAVKPAMSARWVAVPTVLILTLAIVLIGTWTLRLETVARDPVSGLVLSGFSTRAHPVRVLLEPIMGPALEVARQPSLEVFAWLAVGWAVAVSAGLAVLAWMGIRPAKRGLVLFVGIVGVWAVVISFGFAIPDRFEAAGPPGIFIDWHHHAGDPQDGRISISRLERRERARGVSWAIPTHHSRPTTQAAPLAHGLFGTEWSGDDHPNTQSLHVLVLGTRKATQAADRENVDLDAIRAAKAHGALVVIAHYWRTAEKRRVPTFEQLVQAGVDGFEIGNRHGDGEVDESDTLRELDKKVQSAGLLRLSFSDDHGYPAGSPCVTYLEGVEAIRNDDDARAVVSALRRDAPSGSKGSVRVVPLMFDEADPRTTPAAFLVPPAALVHYFRSLTGLERLVWWIYGSVAILWIVPRPFESRARYRLGRLAVRASSRLPAASR